MQELVTRPLAPSRWTLWVWWLSLGTLRALTSSLEGELVAMGCTGRCQCVDSCGVGGTVNQSIFNSREGRGQLSREPVMGVAQGDFWRLKDTQDRHCFGPSSPWQASKPLVMPTYGDQAARLSRLPATAGINSPHSQLSCWRG